MTSLRQQCFPCLLPPVSVVADQLHHAIAVTWHDTPQHRYTDDRHPDTPRKACTQGMGCQARLVPTMQPPAALQQRYAHECMTLTTPATAPCELAVLRWSAVTDCVSTPPSRHCSMPGAHIRTHATCSLACTRCCHGSTGMPRPLPSNTCH